ncbi:hypothetical protein F2Q69_00034129 [Brassica cretica]|uniref:Uncharacterized protein n=1 Tax=Brassica cretica TaxID=69181 RepID=A0A8S9SN58_BRACR|nr:hypothetical protein F2Q69_00034129 [Brassica cretica]
MQAVTELFGVSPENFKSEVSSTGSGESRISRKPFTAAARCSVGSLVWPLLSGETVSPTEELAVHGGALLPSTGGGFSSIFSSMDPRHWKL